MPGGLRRLLICTAFAVCCFANTWVQLTRRGTCYHAHLAPFSAVALPVLCLQAAIAAVLLAAWQFCRWTDLVRSRWLHYAFLAASLVPLGIAAVGLFQAVPFNLAGVVRSRLFWPAAFLLAVPLLAFALVRPFNASRILRGLFLYMCPVLGLIVFQGLRLGALRYPSSAFLDGPLAPRLPSSTGPRVIWIIFDEMSQNQAFTYRPAGLSLPHLDEMRAHGFYGTAAAAPGGSTETSLPALTIGEIVTAARIAGPAQYMLRTASRPAPFSWTSAVNVFDQARLLGANSALVGWFHPYGRLLNRSLVSCYWANVPFLPGVEEPEAPLPLLCAMAQRPPRQLSVVPLVGHFEPFSPRHIDAAERGRRFLALARHAREVVADPSIRLALLHLPVPHPPGFYDRVRGEIGTRASSTYIDNLALADRTLGDLYRAIASAGLAGSTIVLVSADHGWRRGWHAEPGWTAEEEAAFGHRNNMGVPFLVRFPVGEPAVVYDRPFNTVLTARLILDALAGRLTASSQLPEWIERYTRGAGVH
jgi:hypothetical protein